MLTEKELFGLILEKDKAKAEAAIDAMTEEEAKALLKQYMAFFRGDRRKENRKYSLF